MKEKLTSRDIQARETREKLLRTAMELINAEGYRSVTVSRICKECGVSVGTFYTYFKSKRDIVILLLGRHRDYLRSACAVELTGSAMEIYTRFVDDYMEWFARSGYNQSKSMMMAMFQENDTYELLGMEFQRDFLRRLLEYGRGRGEFTLNGVTEQEFIDLFEITVNGMLTRWYISGGALDPVTWGRRFMEELARMLTPPERAGSDV